MKCSDIRNIECSPTVISRIFSIILLAKVSLVEVILTLPFNHALLPSTQRHWVTDSALRGFIRSRVSTTEMLLPLLEDSKPHTSSRHVNVLRDNEDFYADRETA